MADLQPDATLDLVLVPHLRGRTAVTRERRRIRLEGFPTVQGAYVVRYKAREIPRMHGVSPILKSGCTEDPGGFQQRFNNYNHQDLVTVGAPELVDLLRCGGQTTNVMMMYFLAHWAGAEPVVVDLYFATISTPDELETRLLEEYLSKHRELPPLNRGRR